MQAEAGKGGRRWCVRGLAVVAVLAGCLPAGAQDTEVSARILVDGQNALTVPSQQVRLDVDVRIESTLSLAALQFTLDSSDAELWEFVDPPLTVGAPWQQEDLFRVEPEISAGDLLSVRPDILLFKLEPPDYPASSYPADVLTFSLRSTGELPPGEYTFAIDGVALPPVWIHSQGDGEIISDEILSAGLFTLTVTEPLPGDDDPTNEVPVDDPTGDDPVDDPTDGDPADEVPIDDGQEPIDGGDENDSTDDSDPVNSGDLEDPDDTVAPPPPAASCGFGAHGALAVGTLVWATFTGVRRRSWRPCG